MALDLGARTGIYSIRALQGNFTDGYGAGKQTPSFFLLRQRFVDGLVRLLRSEERFPVNVGNPNAQ